MSDEKAAGGVKGTLTGWVKAVITSIVGLLSGAFLMFLTPIINNTIKPPKPLANFATEVTGLTVTFDNHSSGGVQGWWDFGDGSALVPFAPKDVVTAHTYTKPGIYTVKLALQNLLGEDSDRSVAINVDGSNATSPAIEEFAVKPLPGQSQRAPATYQVVSKVKNAAFCLLAYGDERPLQLDTDSTNHDRYVCFEKPGTYLVRLAAVNGKEIAEKTMVINVGASDSTEPMARLRVSYEAVEVKRYDRPFRIQCVWNRDPKESVCPFREERPINPGFMILGAEVVTKVDKSAPVQNLKLEVSPDKTRFILTGELVKSKWAFGAKAAPTWQAEVKVAMERRSPPLVIDSGHVTIPVTLNGTVKLPMQPLPAGFEIVKQRVHLALWDGARKAWEGNQIVKSAPVMLKNQTCYLTMSLQNDGMLLTIQAPTGPAPLVPSLAPVRSESPSVVPSVVRPVNFDLPKPR